MMYQRQIYLLLVKGSDVVKIDCNIIKNIMIEKEFSIKDLAEKANLDKTTISKIINNKIKKNQYKTIGKLSNALEVDVNRLIDKS